jgi:hypothetical protein
MNKKNQISLIKEFINSNEDNILINQVNDEIAIFYLGIIKHYANYQGIKVIDTNTDAIVAEDDLFGTKTIQAFSISNTKKLESILDVHTKKIVFTDYKNYKRLNSKFIVSMDINLKMILIFLLKMSSILIMMNCLIIVRITLLFYFLKHLNI